MVTIKNERKLLSLDFIAPNVLGIRRSSPPYKALRSKAVGWNVGETKHHKGRKPDWCFVSPRAAE